MPNADRIIANSIKRIYKMQLKAGQIDRATYNYNLKQLLKAAEKGLNKDFAKVKFGTPDWQYAQNLKYNTAVFAAFKNHSETTKLAALLTDKKGMPRSWKDFKADAEKVSGLYNKNWLKTEFNHAQNSARSAKDWQRYQERKDLYPNLRYVATKDERTRTSHAELDGAVYPIDHSFWDTYYPPNDWGCRCRVEQVDVDTNEKPGINIPNDFKNNPGKTARLFTPDHPYIRNAKPEFKLKVKQFVESNIRSSADVLKGHTKYLSYGKEWEKAYFDTNTGGYVVKNKLHSKDKETLRKELATAKFLSRKGYSIELVDEITPKIKIYDALVNKVKFEFKTTKSFNNIKKYGKNAADKKATVIIFDLAISPNRDFHRYIDEILRKPGYRPIKEVWWIFKDVLHKKTL